MNTHDQCTEEQAIALAGVSARTLQRFCEAGYLISMKSQDGTVLYQRSQLKEIFGASNNESETENENESGSTYYAEATPSFYSTVSTAAPIAETPPPDAAANSSESVYQSSNSQTPNRDRQNAEVEIERLKNLLAIQERMLDSKDDEIADLKNQRAWLRERIEKLEEKSDRDQILLLSETQTIRSLLAYQESRKSTFRQFLEWIGVAPGNELRVLGQPQPQSSQGVGTTSGRTIEVRQAANAE